MLFQLGKMDFVIMQVVWFGENIYTCETILMLFSVNVLFSSVNKWMLMDWSCKLPYYIRVG